MTKIKKNIIITFFLGFCVIQFWSVYTYKNIWPFNALTMFANAKSNVFKIRTMVSDENQVLKPIPAHWLRPFGRYRSLVILRTQIINYMTKADGKSEFILTDIAKRAAQVCREEKGSHPAHYKKIIYQYCDKCHSTDQSQNWVTVKEVEIDC